ncbi:MAG: glycosyltransferase family 4 protein [Candidatus Schekmanbacteria bacterium]|nr:glycosyltransferase family 4 protein [Candidatus Schekmanbacteria bacterium]
MNNKYRIAINATFLHANPTGLGRYVSEITRNLLKQATDYHFTLYADSHSFPGQKADLLKSFGLFGRHWGRLLDLQTAAKYKLKNAAIDLFYSPVAEGILNSNIKQIITIHDLTPVKYREYHPLSKYYFDYFLPRLINKSEAIICVSEHTRQDVIDYYGVKNKNIYVIYNGYEPDVFYPRIKKSVAEKYNLSPYFLYVGDMRPHKNLPRSLKALADLNVQEIKFVVVGRKERRFFPGIKSLVEELHLENRVVFLDYVPENDLPDLYSGAIALVFPSLYEGFGYPALEAMACGCPVITSDVASLPEICGEAAYYVDPEDVESIRQGMQSVLHDDFMRNNMIYNGLERAKPFKWDKAAQGLMKIFGSVLNKRP